MPKINPRDYEVEDSRPQSRRVKMSANKKVRKNEVILCLLI